MPSIILSVPQTSETVTRAVARVITQDLVKSYGFKPNVFITYKEASSIAPPTTGGTLDPTPVVKLADEDNVIVTIDEQFTDTGILTSGLYRMDYPYLFVDKQLGIYMAPTYTGVKVTLAIQLIFKNKSAGDRFKRLFRVRGSARSLGDTHEIRYNYSLPDTVLAFLYDAHQQMVVPAGTTKETLSQYLDRCFYGGLGRRTTQSKSATRLILDEVQGNIVGEYSEELFYNELAMDNGHYTISCNYAFEYLQIIGISLEYPLVIGNKYIPKVYRELWGNPQLHDFQTSPAVHKTLSYMPPIWLSEVNGVPRYQGGYYLDPLETWLPVHNTPHTLTIALTAVKVDPTAPTAVLKLSDFTEAQLPLFIRTYITMYPTDSLSLYSSPFHVQLYQVGNEEKEVTITISPTGEIRSVLPMSPEYRYYLRISMMVDLTRLTVVHASKMINTPVETREVFNYLSPDRAAPLLKVIGNKKITAVSYREALAAIPITGRDFEYIHNTHPRRSMATVISPHALGA